MKNRLLVVIPAAGIGQRFNKELPKQYSKLNYHDLKGYTNKSAIWNYFFLKRKTFSEIKGQ